MQQFKKQALVELLLTQLKKERDILRQAALATYEAATHEESKAEDKYDTRGLEASYLAGAQAKRTAEIEQAIFAYERLGIRSFEKNTPLSMSALVKLENEEGERIYFLGPQAGGQKLTQAGETIVVVTHKSPLGRHLLGKQVGDVVEIEQEKRVLEYEIIDVC